MYFSYAILLVRDGITLSVLYITSKQVNHLPAGNIALKASAGSFDLCGECYMIISIWKKGQQLVRVKSSPT